MTGRQYPKIAHIYSRFNVEYLYSSYRRHAPGRNKRS